VAVAIIRGGLRREEVREVFVGGGTVVGCEVEGFGGWVFGG
jgi:hypothetical protein